MPPKKAGTIETDVAPRRSSRNTASVPQTTEPLKTPSIKRAAPDHAEKDVKEVKKAKKDVKDKSETVTLPKIEIGDVVPPFTLKNEKGEDVDVAKLTEQKGLILFLVPKADTPGCTTQACGFRDIYPDFSEEGYEVYCLSHDTSSAQLKWQTKKELPYPLLSDSKRVLISALGASDGAKTKRSHFIFAKGGKLLDKQIPVKAADSPKIALAFIKSLSE